MEENLRKHILEAQFKHLLDEKDAKIASLNHQIENLKQGDESITQEMESIGQVHFLAGALLIDKKISYWPWKTFKNKILI